MGAGVAFDTAVDLEPSNVASREILDRQTPSSELCMANGASAMVFDQRVFMSLNPFNIYVAQPEVKPGCVLRRSNWSVLERKQLVDGDQEADCKRGMNTFAFVGDLDKSPEVSCVYHSEAAENQYVSVFIYFFLPSFLSFPYSPPSKTKTTTTTTTTHRLTLTPSPSCCLLFHPFISHFCR